MLTEFFFRAKAGRLTELLHNIKSEVVSTLMNLQQSSRSEVRAMLAQLASLERDVSELERVGAETVMRVELGRLRGDRLDLMLSKAGDDYRELELLRREVDRQREAIASLTNQLNQTLEDRQCLALQLQVCQRV